jgi:hypothetical protein
MLTGQESRLLPGKLIKNEGFLADL